MTSLVQALLPFQALLLLGENAFAVAFGATYTVTLTHTCELALARHRGLHITVIHLVLMLGAVLGQLLYQLQRDAALVIVGVFGMVLAGLAVLCTHFFVWESPAQLNGDDGTASRATASALQPQDCPEELEMDPAVTPTTPWRRLLLPLLLKFAFVLSFNTVLNATTLYRTDVSFSDGHQVPIVQASVACLAQLFGHRRGLHLLLFRVLGIFLSLWMVDYNRRLHLSTIPVAGALLCVYAVYDRLSTAYYSHAIQALFQFMCGLGLGFTADIYSVESLHVRHRQRLLGYVLIGEFLMQFVGAALFVGEVFTTVDSIAGFRVVSGILLIVCGTVVLCVAPNTARLSLDGARDKFL